MFIRTLPWAACVLLALGSGCASREKPIKSLADFGFDARECGKQSQMKFTTPLNLIGLPNFAIEAGVHPFQFGDCMEQRGWKTVMKDKPEEDQAVACRKAAMGVIAQGGKSIKSTFDEQLYAECRSNGISAGQVIVLPLQSEPADRP